MSCLRPLVGWVAAAFVALLVLAGPASAHVTVSSSDAKPGGYAVVTFRVPTESANASTTALTVQLPASTPFASVDVQPVPGWSISTKSAPLAKPIETDDGDRITSAVSQIVWKARSASSAIKPGQFQQFGMQLGTLPDKGNVTFKALQTYSDGDVVRWIETPAPGSKTEPAHPAPVLTLAPPSPAASASPKSAAAPSTTGPVVLSIVALVVAAGALGLAVVSRARRAS